MEKDPQYIGNLEQLPPDERKMYLMGDWNVFKGQFFPEYNENIHVIEPFVIPKSWRKFISMDYGFDTTCALWWAVDNTGAREYVYRELHQPNMTLSEAANKILEYTSKDEEISYISASPDLINRSHDTGMSGFEIMRNCGLKGIRAADDRRIAGWIECREHMKSFPNLMGDKLTSRLQIFKTCEHLRHSLKNLIFDDKTPNDANDKPHEITHAADAFRYGCMSRPSAAPEQEVKELTEWERFYERENEHERINGYSNW
jgi:phage terminase large subunit